MKNIIKYIKFFIAISLFFFGSVLRYIPIFIFKLDPNNLTDRESVLLTLFSNLVSFIILVLMYRKSIVKGFKDLKKKKAKPLLEGFDIWFVGLMVMVVSNAIISWFNKGATSTNEESIRFLLKNFPYITIASVAILSPCIEEFVFRKSFKEIFNNKWVYLITSGLVFGALHVFLSPINSFIDYFYLIPYCSMGIAFAYMYYKTDNILVSLTMHIAHNSINVITTLLMAGAIIW